MRTPLVLGNWKMNGSLHSNAELLQALLSGFQAAEKVQVAVCAPYVYLAQVAQLLQGSAIGHGAQDISIASKGAYTGEISAQMLQEFDCTYVLVGHSERRDYHHESDALVAKKFQAAQQAGLTPVLCVGETLAQREADETLAVIGKQLQAVMALVGAKSLAAAVIAYEPVWAIGTGLTASPEQAQEVHAYIRQQLGAEGVATQILYGGSVKPNSAPELFKQADIDGALVGGAALNAADFLAIAAAV